MTTTHAFDAVILIAHGARDDRWMEPFYRIRSVMEGRLPGVMIGLAFMEFAKPTFADTAAAMHQAGKRHVLVVPVFQSGGGHVAHDIPTLIQPEETRYPIVRFTVSGALGEEPEVARGMSDAVARLVKSNDAAI